MNDLTKIDTPFGLLDDATKRALENHGGPYEFVGRSGWTRVVAKIGFSPGTTYRVKPQPPTKPSINWDHVSPEYRWLAQDKSGEVWIYDSQPIFEAYKWTDRGIKSTNAAIFASLTPGTCAPEDSLVERTG